MSGSVTTDPTTTASPTDISTGSQDQITEMQQTFEQAIATSEQITIISTAEKAKLDATKQRPQN